MFSASKTAGPSGYNIANSLRFRSSASAYLSRTPASAGNQQKFTFSFWLKRGTLSTTQEIFDSNYGGGSTEAYLGFNAGTDQMSFGQWDGSTNVFRMVPTQVFRDPSAWYHFVIAVDTTQATAANRILMYINGLQITSFSTATYPSQNYSTGFNAAVATYIGKQFGNQYYFDGYLADINFIDGQALTPSSFGVIDTLTGVWKPIAYSGSYGTNGFHLNFSNGTSTTTLGYDSSGNGNNWTTNNISLTSGSTYDSMWDSPTSYDNGVNGVGNYAVLNPIGLVAGSASISLSNANLTFNATAGSTGRSIATVAMPSGKWYAEFAFSSYTGSGDDNGFGVINAASTTTALGQEAGSIVYIGATGQIRINNAYSSYGSTYGVGDIVGVAFDAATNKIWFAKNGTWQASGDPAAGTNPATTLTSVVNSCFAVNYNAFPTTFAANANFGQRPFAYTPPSGYKSLCTYNLPTPTIQNGAGYMAATTYTGNGSSQSIVNTVNGVSFQPDFVWLKDRTNAYSHQLYDTIRGAGKLLNSNSTNAESTSSTNLTAFTSTGFTLGSDAGTNQSTDAYIGWNWKAGGTAVTNTAGSITSSVSANTTAGFSVVTYTGTGSAATVGHGLGIAPSMIIVKNRTTAGEWWHVYLKALGATQALFLNSTNAVGTSSDWWNNTSPTSSVFTVNISGAVNGNSASLVAYCFAAIPGYSAFGSYTGNGSTDGPFVYCGFRPRFVMIKNSSATASWLILDTARLGYNGGNNYLYPNLSNSENSGTNEFDILSNGFKPRYGSSAAFNSNGATYIYACFAENPFQNALAR